MGKATKIAGVSAAGVAGAAPNVSAFVVGTRNSDGSYTAAMSWDALGTSLVVQFKITAPADRSNFGGAQIAVTPPDSSTPQVATRLYDCPQTGAGGTDFGPDGLGNWTYEGQVEIHSDQIPAMPIYLTFTCASANANGVLNVDPITGYPVGVAVLLLTLAPTAAILQPPSQPASFTATVVEFGYDNNNQRPVAHLQVSVPAFTAGANVVRVWQYVGATAPTDPSGWGTPIMNGAVAASGATVIDWWTPRSKDAALTVWIRVRAGSATYNTGPADAGLADQSVSIAQVGLPSQPTGLTVAPISTSSIPAPATLGATRQNRGGTWCGALVIAVTPPASLEYFTTRFYSIQCDNTYTPLTGAVWSFIGSGVTGFDQRALSQWWAIGSADGWVQIKAQAVSRVIDSTGANLENTASPPTVNLHVTASSGLDTTALATPVQSAQLATGIIDSLSMFGSVTLRPLVSLPAYPTALPSLPSTSYPIGAVVFYDPGDGHGGRLYRNAGNVWAAGSPAIDITAGTLVSGVIYAGAIGVSQLTAGTATFTGDVIFQRAAQAYVGINSAGIYLAGGVSGSNVLSQLAVTPTAITIQQGTSGPYVQITSTEINIQNTAGANVKVDAATITMSNGVGSTLSLSATEIDLQNATTGAKLTLTSASATIRNSSATLGQINLDSSGVCTFRNNSGTTATIDGSSGSFGILSSVSLSVTSGILDILYGNGSTLINYAKEWVGAGVACPSNGIGAAGFNPYVSSADSYRTLGYNTGLTKVIMATVTLALPGGTVTGQVTFNYDGGVYAYERLVLTGGVLTNIA